jgi:hypothetical protein
MIMSRHSKKSIPKVAGEGFSLNRYPLNLSVDGYDRNELANRYPSHQLFSTGRMALNLVRRNEIIKFLSFSERIRRMDYKKIIDQIIASSAPVSEEVVNVRPKRLVFTKANKSGNSRITIPVDDEDHILRDEREAYIKELSKICRVRFLDMSPFIPEVSVGRTINGVEPSIDALHLIRPYIPELITLSPAKAYPMPEQRPE